MRSCGARRVQKGGSRRGQRRCNARGVRVKCCTMCLEVPEHVCIEVQQRVSPPEEPKSRPFCIRLVHIQATARHGSHSRRGGIALPRPPWPLVAAAMARTFVRAPLERDLPASRCEEAALAYGGCRGALRWTAAEMGASRAMSTGAPARDRHGRAVRRALAHSLPMGVGGRRGRQSVGARPCGGRAVAPTRASSHSGLNSRRSVGNAGTGARMQRRGGAYRIEAVGAGHGEHAKTASSKMRCVPSSVITPELCCGTLRTHAGEGESRDEDGRASGFRGARAQRERMASRCGRARW